MKSKKLSIIVTLLWFALVGVLYLLFALVWKVKPFYLPFIESPSTKELVLRKIYVILPPLCWWIPRRLLIRTGKWHRAGTIAFCIGNASLLLAECLLLLFVSHNSGLENSIVWNAFLDPFAFCALGFVCIFLLVSELIFVILRPICAKMKEYYKN